ncbi:hypothetical protein O181_003706 [Austropuccinia psidii MF-1]|uniref:CCHC-type domain-containing protein n=1 Tax=Austropuccinia psidii MF-1 TaxID=1389203 RepID=A0A9Q3GED7_9BASI|nr:hypothetical protein [Austropuccinia psidii MF-1]
MESNIFLKTFKEDRRRERTVLKCHKCGRASHLASTCTKKTKINELQVIEEVQGNEVKEESDQDSAIPEDYPMENIAAFFEVTEVHTNSPQYSEDFCNLISFKDARMCKAKPARKKFFTSGASFITSK